MAVVKIKQYGGIDRYGEKSIETHQVSETLRQAQWRMDARLHDLRSEFLQREHEIRAAYLNEVAEINGFEQ